MFRDACVSERVEDVLLSSSDSTDVLSPALRDSVSLRFVFDQLDAFVNCWFELSDGVGQPGCLGKSRPLD